MTVREALLFFANVPKITKKLKVLDEVGLGYLAAGAIALRRCPAARRSASNWRRICARETSEKTLFIFDEPTTGLTL